MNKRIIAGSLLSMILLSAAALAACEPQVQSSASTDTTQTTISQTTVPTTTVPKTEPKPTQTLPPESDHVHSLGDWAVFQPAGCISPQLDRRSCACGFYEQREIGEPNGVHLYDDAGQCTGCDRKVSVGLFYKLNGDKTAYTVIGIGSCEDTVLTIPEVYKGKPVTAIRDFAFASMGTSPSALRSITIPGTVTEIGKAAFAGCQMLTEIHVDPDSQHFACQDSILFTKDLGTLLVYPGGKTEQRFTVPEHVHTLGEFAFAYCTELKQVVLSDAVQHIGEGAFGSSALEKIHFGAGMKTLGHQVFAMCKKLTGIEVAANNPYFSAKDGVLMHANGSILYVYPAGKNEESYTVPAGVRQIAPEAFYGCLGLKKLQLPDSVTEISDSAFYDCADLQQVHLGNGIVTIGQDAFSWCVSLTQVTLGERLETLGENAFYGCSRLKELTLPKSLKKLSRGALGNCDSLQKLHYTGTVQQWRQIEKQTAWDGITSNYTLYCADMTTFCAGLQYVLEADGSYTVAGIGTCKDKKIIVPPLYRGLPVTKIADLAFAECSAEEIVLPDTITSIGVDVFRGCKSLQTIEVVQNNGQYVSLDGVLFNKDMTVLLAYPEGKRDTEYTLPEGVQVIDYRGFYDCDWLVSLHIPASVHGIGREALYHCDKLQALHFGGTVDAWETVEKGELWNANSPKLQIHCANGAVGQETWTVIGTMGGDSFTVDIPMVQQMDGSWCTVEAIYLEEGDQLMCRLGGSWEQVYPEEPYLVEDAGTYFILLEPLTGHISLIPANV